MTGLAQYDPLWQPVRATGEPTRVYEDDQVLIATDFEGGNGAHIRRLGSGEYAVTLEPEPGEHRFSGRSYYYCVGVRSKRPAASTVRLRLEGHAHGTESFGRDVRHAVLRRGGTWSHLDPSAIRSLGDDALTLDLPLPAADEPDPVLFVSDFHWWPYSEVAAYVRSLNGVDGVAVREIGRSALGRPLYAVEIGPPGAPCMVHAATPQASEMGHLACRAMIDYVTSPDPEAAAIRDDGRAWLLLDDGRRIQAARVTVFPQADPARHDVQVRVELPEVATGLLPGMIANPDVAPLAGEGFPGF